MSSVTAAVDESAIDTVIHVAVDGNDSNNGMTAASAVASPEQGVALALPYLEAGTAVKVLIHPGTYHLQAPLRVIGWDIGDVGIETPFVLAGSAPGAVTLTGAIDWSTGWENLGDGLYSRHWPYSWGQAPEPWDSHNYVLGQAMTRREMLLVNGEILEQRLIESHSWDSESKTWTYDGGYGGVGELPAGSFAVSEIEEQRIWMCLPAGLSVADAQIELPVRDKALEIRRKDNVVMRNLTFRAFNDAIGSGYPIQIVRSNNALVEDCTFEYQNINGFGFNLTSNALARRLVARHNGWKGMGASGNTDTVIEDVEVAHNNWRGARSGHLSWDSGGLKVTSLGSDDPVTPGLTLRRIYAHHNQGTGLWLDVNCTQSVIEDCVVVDNTRYGMYYEFTNGSNTFKDNIIARNLVGILIATARNALVTDNVIIDNSFAQVAIRTNERGSDANGLPYKSVDATITGNTMIAGSTTQRLIAHFSGATADIPPFLSSLHAADNRYYGPSTEAVFMDASGSPVLDFTAWTTLLVEHSAKDAESGSQWLGANPYRGDLELWAETWDDVPGTTVADLSSHAAYRAGNPDRVEALAAVEQLRGWGGDTGSRINAVLVAPVSGMYQFSLSGDHSAFFLLGSDEKTSSLSQRSAVSAPTNPRGWDESGAGTVSITLEAGRAYALQVLHKNGNAGGQGHVSLGWKPPGAENWSVVSGLVLKTTRSAMPIITPGDGSILLDNTTATITCQTPGAVIHYTTDGRDPTPSSSRYSGPISISAGSAIRARAYHQRYAPSAVARAAYTGDTADKVFQQDADGMVVMEAESYRRSVASTTHAWSELAVAEASGGVAMVTPQLGRTFVAPGDEVAHLEYNITFHRSSTHYLWLRAYGDPGSATLHASLSHNSQQITTIKWWGNETWKWDNRDTSNGDSPAAFTITTPGTYTLRITMRQDGLRLDKLLLTTDPNYIPTGLGPDESERVSALNQAPVLTPPGDRLLPAVSYPVSTSASLYYEDDGLPIDPGSCTVQWQLIDGPAAISISDPAATSTDLTFTTGGSYLLRCVVSDGARSSAALFTVHVVPLQDTRIISMRSIPNAVWSMDPGPDDPIPTTSGDLEIFAPTLNMLQQHLELAPAGNH